MPQFKENIINYYKETRMLNDFPKIKKTGAISPYGEVTPFYFNGAMYRLELRDHTGGLDSASDIRALIREYYTGKIIATLGEGCYYYSFYQEGNKAYVLGTERQNGSFCGDTIYIFESEDLVNWKKRKLLERKGWKYYNTSLTKCEDGYVILMEASEGAGEEIGVPFTFFFAKSKDMVNWEFLPTETAFSRNIYNGGPWMKYANGYFYVISVTELPFQRYTNYLYRTKDFLTWEVGKYNPLLSPSLEDRKLSPYACELDSGWQKKIKDMFIASSSDFDCCYDPENKITRMCYLLGNQLGDYYMAEAEIACTVEEFLENNFI